jgi:uncharacterized protein (TIGR01244 family)
MQFLELDTKTLVAGQLQAAEVGDAAARGVTMIVNNRPDGEEADQPTAVEIEAAAQAAGLGYVHIPISAEFSDDKVQAMGDALSNAQGRVLIFCRSGTRSAYLWALARKRQGADADMLIHQARHAGYDLKPLLPWLKPAED